MIRFFALIFIIIGCLHSAAATSPLPEKTIIFVTHGAIDWDNQASIHQPTAAHLNAEGRQQAEKTANLLGSAKLPIHCIYASPLDRSRETAEIIQAKLQLPIKYIANLRERDYADRPQDEDNCCCTRRDDEPLDAFRARILAVFQRLLSNTKEDTILVVSHGGIFKCLSEALLGHTQSITHGAIAQFLPPNPEAGRANWTLQALSNKTLADLSKKH